MARAKETDRLEKVYRQINLDDINNVAELLAEIARFGVTNLSSVSIGGGYDESTYVHFYSPENDAEYEFRMQQIEAQKIRVKQEKADREARDRKEYERLKKKFGDK